MGLKPAIACLLFVTGVELCHKKRGMDLVSSSSGELNGWKPPLDMMVMDAVTQVTNYMDTMTLACNSSRFYTLDGTCNNLQNPLWGAAFQPFVREIDNAYTDGTLTPRLYAEGDGEDDEDELLPSARAVSTHCLPSLKNETIHDLDSKFNQNLMQFGQFFSHDLGMSPVMEGFNCCSSLDEHGLHPETFSGEACFPISVADDDRYFQGNCMGFNRTAYVVDDEGVAQQLNAATHVIDQSTVYGSPRFCNSIRTFSDGKLRTDEHGMLPQDDTQKCLLFKPLHGCPVAGDNRVSVFPGLTATHLVFHLEHNRVAEALKSRHPEWTDEQLFQNARAIVIAETQNLVYKEYLPAFLGFKVISFFGLRRPARYNPQQNPSILNAFQTAAFRFGHSQINNVYRLDHYAEDRNIHDVFFCPNNLFDKTGKPSYGELMLSLMTSRGQKVDPSFAEGVADKLFLGVDGEGHSSDLAARNVQRGRDHGLPPYLHYLDRAWETFGPGGDIISQAALPDCDKKVYRSVRDIDLFVGGLYEEPVPGGLVGPTFAYLIGKQFKHLREGDRLFFDTYGSGAGFDQRQIRSIKKTSYAGIICRVTGLKRVPRHAFKLPHPRWNPMVDCDRLRDINFSLW